MLNNKRKCVIHGIMTHTYNLIEAKNSMEATKTNIVNKE